MRRFGEAWRSDIAYRERPGAYAILQQGDQMLVAETDSPDEQFQLPGGGVDPGENPLPALHREVMEETGWTMRPIRRLGFFHRYCYMPDYTMWAHKICTLYLCAPVMQVADPVEPDHRPCWMAMEDAAQMLCVSGDRWFVSELLRGRV